MQTIQDIAKIQIGYQIRTRRTGFFSSGGTCRLLQIKDIVDGKLTPAKCSRINPTGDVDRYRVHKGDVLYLSRGSSPMAFPVLEELDAVVASYYFFILRITSASVLPEYLAWFLNHRRSRSNLEKQMRGSVSKVLPKNALAMLTIPVPSLDKQHCIIELETLRIDEAHILGRLVEQRKRFLDELLVNAAVDRGG